MIIALILSLFTFLLPVQGQPVFKGGERSLNSFLLRNLVYPEYSRQNCLQGTVNISFSLNGRGRIYRSSVARGFGTDLDKEALRIVRLTSGQWTVPAGYDTTVSIVLPVHFDLQEEQKCRNVSRDDMSAAISAYRSYEGLTDAVLNFYDNKLVGKYDPSQEQHIAGLKAQLGYDEKYIDRLLKQATAKLKQKDKEGACEDLNFIRRLGSLKADKLIAANCGSK